MIRARCKGHLISPKGSNTFVEPRSSHFSIPGGPVAHSYLSIVDDSSLLFASAWAGNPEQAGDFIARKLLRNPVRQLSNLTYSAIVSLRNSPNLRAGLRAPLAPDPRSRVRTHKPACCSSARVLQCAMPVQRFHQVDSTAVRQQQVFSKGRIQ